MQLPQIPSEKALTSTLPRQKTGSSVCKLKSYFTISDSSSASNPAVVKTISHAVFFATTCKYDTKDFHQGQGLWSDLKGASHPFPGQSRGFELGSDCIPATSLGLERNLVRKHQIKTCRDSFHHSISASFIGLHLEFSPPKY